MAPTQVYKGKQPGPLNTDEPRVQASVLKTLLEGWIKFYQMVELPRKQLTDFEPEACKRARMEWVSESSQLNRFFDEYCVRHEEAFVSLEVLWVWFQQVSSHQQHRQAFQTVSRMGKRHFKELVPAEFTVTEKVTKGEQRDLRNVVYGLGPNTEIFASAAFEVAQNLCRRPGEWKDQAETGHKKEPKPVYKRFHDPVNGQPDEWWEERFEKDWRNRHGVNAPLIAIEGGKAKTGKRAERKRQK